MARRRRRSAGGETRRGCKLVIFHRGRKEVPVERCEGRKLSTSAARRWKHVRGRTICRAKRTGRFRACR